MKRQIFLTGILMVLAALLFWISWSLMPDPGTTDTNHILGIVKQARASVLASVITQIVSSVLYVCALLFLVRISVPQKKTMTGLVLFAIGVLGLCADAFFHLLAWFMTDDSVTIQEDVVRVMNFMQTKGLIFLVPILVPFFFGNLLLAIGLNKQVMTSRMPELLFIAAFLMGIASAVASKIPDCSGSILTMTAIGLFAAGQAAIGVELIKFSRQQKHALITAA